MRLFGAALRFQLSLARRSDDVAYVFLTTPLLTLVFLAMYEYAGRRNLAGYAVLGPTLMSLWSMALFAAGDLINEDRAAGRLEALAATPARFPTVVLGRITAVTALSLVNFVESWLVAGLAFGHWVRVYHLTTFALCLALSAWAMAGTASALSAVFVLAPSARTVQNTLSYPVYLLGGVVVPVTYLPGWLQPLSKGVFLSWSADLLRDTLRPAPVTGLGARVAALVLLSLVGYALGVWLLRRFLRTARAAGSIANT